MPKKTEPENKPEANAHFAEWNGRYGSDND